MSITGHTNVEASLLRPFKLPTAIYGEGFIGMTREHYDRLVKMLDALTDATADTLRAHAEETSCCVLTRSRCEQARKLLTDEQQDVKP